MTARAIRQAHRIRNGKRSARRYRIEALARAEHFRAAFGAQIAANENAPYAENDDWALLEVLS